MSTVCKINLKRKVPLITFLLISICFSNMLIGQDTYYFEGYITNGEKQTKLEISFKAEKFSHDKKYSDKVSVREGSYRINNGSIIQAQGYIENTAFNGENGGPYIIKLYKYPLEDNNHVCFYFKTDSELEYATDEIEGTYNEYLNDSDFLGNKPHLSLSATIKNKEPKKQIILEDFNTSEEKNAEEQTLSFNAESDGIENDYIENDTEINNREEEDVSKERIFETDKNATTLHKKKSREEDIDEKANSINKFSNVDTYSNWIIALFILCSLLLFIKWFWFKQYLPFRSKCSNCGKKNAMVVFDEDYEEEHNSYITIKQNRKCKYCNYEDGVFRHRRNSFLG